MGFADYPFTSRFMTVDGHRLHYIDEGPRDTAEGKAAPVLLFVHGNPTSSYLWRNVIKPLSDDYRCIAIDLIGFGKSDKPDLDYRFLTHYRYLRAFVEDLNLKDLHLVLHDWGGPLGFRLAQREPERVRGLCFMETFPFTFDWEEFPLAARPLFFAFRRPRLSYWLLQKQNLFINVILRLSTMRHLPHSVMAAYRAPFPNTRSRLPIRVFPSELPINDHRGETWRAIHEIENGLSDMPQPMLLLAFRPGAVLGRPRIAWLRQRIANLEVVPCGRGLHYVQEDNPQAIAAALAAWLKRLDERARHTGSITPPVPDQEPEPAPEPGLDRAPPPSPPAASGAGVPTVVAEDDRLTGLLRWAYLETEYGPLVGAWSERGLVMLSFAESREEGREQVRQRFPKCSLEQDPGERIEAALASPETVKLHLVGTPFQRRVWKALIAIPRGHTRQYGELAKLLDSQARAVGSAVGSNRIALLVPCHRVLPRSGGLGGYHWGVARKKALLAAEGVSPR